MEEKVFNAIKDKLKEANIELLSVKIGEEDGQTTMFITIDSENGVTIKLCEEANKIVNPILDSLDLELEGYILDIGSKGTEE
ncbi:MAG: hypothetical protein IJB82_04655 [Bacilli bacterium]|nr:hypothetical protein [Bacilli bacterium]